MGISKECIFTFKKKMYSKGKFIDTHTHTPHPSNELVSELVTKAGVGTGTVSRQELKLDSPCREWGLNMCLSSVAFPRLLAALKMKQPGHQPMSTRHAGVISGGHSSYAAMPAGHCTFPFTTFQHK